MPLGIDQTLKSDAIRLAFLEQSTILYNAKASLIVNLPGLISQANFKNLKHALQEDLDDSTTQMFALKEIFRLLDESLLTEDCLGMTGVITEALKQVTFKKHNHYQSDMSILFYLSAMENMQLGAYKILQLLSLKLAYQPYAQLVLECLDNSRENSKLIQFVADEYFGN